MYVCMYVRMSYTYTPTYSLHYLHLHKPDCLRVFERKTERLDRMVNWRYEARNCAYAIMRNGVWIFVSSSSSSSSSCMGMMGIGIGMGIQIQIQIQIQIDIQIQIQIQVDIRIQTPR